MRGVGRRRCGRGRAKFLEKIVLAINCLLGGIATYCVRKRSALTWFM